MFTIQEVVHNTVDDKVNSYDTDALLTWGRNIRSYYDCTIILQPGVTYKMNKRVPIASDDSDSNKCFVVTFDKPVYLMKKRYTKVVGDDRTDGSEVRYFTDLDTDVMKRVNVYKDSPKPTLHFEPLDEELFIRTTLIGAAIDETRDMSKRNSRSLYDYPTALDFYEECDELTTLLVGEFQEALDYHINWLQGYGTTYQRPRHWSKQ